MNNRLNIISIFFISFFLFSTAPCGAGETIDTDFAVDGFAVRDFGIGDDEILAMTVQPDGRVLVAGYSSNGAVRAITVSRYLPGGKQDTSFNFNGVFTYSLGGGDSAARSLAILEDGRIAVLCTGFDENPLLGLFLLTPDGYPDTMFGENGLQTLSVEGEQIVSADLKTGTGTAFFLGATVTGADFSRSFLFRLNAKGEEDGNFGDNGVVIVGSNSGSWLQSLLLLQKDKILVGGAVERDGSRKAALWQFNGDGSVDLKFADQGELLPETGGDVSVVRNLSIGLDGRILLAGTIRNEQGSRAFVVRLNKDFSTDDSFAVKGIFKSELKYETEGLAVTTDNRGDVVLVGTVGSAGNKDVALWTIPSWGRIPDITGDKELQENGFVSAKSITDMAGEDDIGYAVVSLESGKILVAGSTGKPGSRDFFLARYIAGRAESDSRVGDVEEGVLTEDYRLQTLPVIDISRIGGVSGGIITDTRTLSCESSCATECGETETTCYSECLETCGNRPTIKLRGVCFSLKREPQYNEKEEEEPSIIDNITSIFGKKVTKESFLFNLVRSGQTEDGSGTGKYESAVSEVTPGMTYYLRAYAVLSDGKILYGNEVQFTTDDACFIATAAYGSPGDPCVAILRDFRDSFLITSEFGRKLVATYYRLSPVVASIIQHSKILRFAVRVLLYPFVLFALFMVKTSVAMKYTIVVIAVMSAGSVLAWSKIRT